MKASTGFCTLNRALRVWGTGGRITGWRDQNWRAFLRLRSAEAGARSSPEAGAAPAPAAWRAAQVKAQKYERHFMSADSVAKLDPRDNLKRRLNMGASEFS